MELDTIKLFSETFGNIYFPIACCLVLFYIVTKQNAALKKAIDENTKVLSELKTLIQLTKTK